MNVRQVIVFVGAVLLVACQKSLPTAPSDLATGIVIYQHANALGGSAHVTTSVSDLKDVRGPCVEVESNGSTSTTHEWWNDCISSIRVAPGWRATVYRDPGFNGQSLTISADVPNLQLVSGTCDHDGLNDCISSIRIFAP